MNNKTKTIFRRALSLALALCCFCSVFIFSSCSVLEKPASLTINGTKIGNDVFTYFLDCAVTEMGVQTPYESLVNKATALAGTYYKTNSLAHTYNISLTTAQKAAVSEKVNAYWGIYGNYYTNIGVTKETLTKVFTADSYRDALLLHYYGEGGIEEIPVSRLYANFKSNYIVFQAITGYFTEIDTAGNTIRLNKNDTETLVLKFQNMSAMVNAGEQTMEEAADYLTESGYPGSVQTVVLHKDDTSSYPEGFFTKVQSIDTRYAAIIASNDYIFLVLKGDADVNSSFFTDKKTDIIKALVGDSIDTTIENAYQLETKISHSTAKGYYTLIKDTKGA
ncbi:MAG: hypothetical protein IJ025_00820 [Clostridia bacterium]|nr:hypothetical protein [Clostridia bacterium]